MPIVLLRVLLTAFVLVGLVVALLPRPKALPGEPRERRPAREMPTA